VTAQQVERLAQAVQTNCHIADARHAADLTLCTYLLQMREFYRWEQGLPFGAVLPREAVGAWLTEREREWAALEGQGFVALPVGVRQDEHSLDPFDVDTLNEQLLPQSLVYGAGLAGPGRPGFFLAQLERLEPVDEGLTLQVCGCEHARGLFAPPAVLAGDTIVLRRESLARWLWEKFEAFSLRRSDGPFKAVADAYGLERDFGAALPRMQDELSEVLILHEIGEHRAGRRLEPHWATMRLALTSRRADLHVRAVRDHLADLRVTLPTLLQRGADTAIHFWFATFDGVREQLFASLWSAYQAWRDGDGGQALAHAADHGAAHFEQLALQVLALHDQHGENADAAIERLLGSPQAVCPTWT
jgi:hypothetical protein